MSRTDTLEPPTRRAEHPASATRAATKQLPARAGTERYGPRQLPAPETPGGPENWAQVRAAQDGDPEAFGALYDEYAGIVYRYVFIRVNDHCLAEDITSETFLRALRRIATVSYQGRDIAAWFVTIARNLVLDHVKSGRNRLEFPTADLTDCSPAHLGEQIGPEQHVLTAAAHLELRRCLRQLNPDQHECIRLRFIQGLSVTETAALMGRNEGAVKALQHRAVRRLAQLLPHDLR